MKVRDIDSMSNEMPKRIREDSATAKLSLEQTFSRCISDTGAEQYRKKIADLTEKINYQGEIVAKRADIREMQKYRTMITELINETVSNAYSFHKENSFDGRGRPRIYAIIKQVNEKLDQMTQSILSEQSDKIQLMHCVDDIRGLLVDMFL